VASPLNVHAKGHHDEERVRATPESAELGSNPKATRAEDIFGQDLEVMDFTLHPRGTEGVAHGQIHSLLIERLEDVSFHFFCIFV
jgi:hypothetical protein